MKKSKLNLKTKWLAASLTAGMAVGALSGRLLHEKTARSTPQASQKPSASQPQPKTDAEKRAYIQGVTMPLPSHQGGVYGFFEFENKNEAGERERLGSVEYYPFDPDANRFVERIKLTTKDLEPFGQAGNKTDPLYGNITWYRLTKNMETGKFVSCEVKFVTDSDATQIQDTEHHLIDLRCCSLIQEVAPSGKYRSQLQEEDQISFITDGLNNHTTKSKNPNPDRHVHFWGERQQQITIPGADAFWEEAKQLYEQSKEQMEEEQQTEQNNLYTAQAPAFTPSRG